jgi:hypothetical protein
MAVRPTPAVMLTTTGSGTWAKEDRPRSTAGLPARRPLVQRQAVPAGPAPRLPKTRAATLVAAAAGAAGCCRGGTPRRTGGRLRCKLARCPLRRRPAALSEVRRSARALVMRLRSRDVRAMAGRDTRCRRLTRQPPRCQAALPGLTRAGRSPMIMGRSPAITGRGPATTRPGLATAGCGLTTTGRSPARALPCQSGGRYGPHQDLLPPGARPDMRLDPQHRGRQRPDPLRHGSRPRSRLSGLPAVADRILSAGPRPPRSTARPRWQPPRRRVRSRPRQ